MKTISERFYNQSQSWIYERIVRVREQTKLRVLITRNAYDAQSSVRGYMLDPINLRWNLIVDRPIMGAACYAVSYTNKTEDKELFEVDSDSVLEELNQIL